MSTAALPMPEATGARGLRGLLDFLRLFARFAKASLRHWRRILLLVTLAQATGLMWVLSAMAMAKCVDEGLRAGDRGAFLGWCLIWFLVQFILLVVYNIQTIMSTYIRVRLDLLFKLRIYDHFQRLSLRIQGSRPIGENMFRLNNDTTVTAGVASAAIPDTLTRLVTIATTASLLFGLNKWIAISVLVYMLIYYVYAHLVTTYSARYQAALRDRGQATLAILQENLTAYAISKAMGRERHESRRYFGRVAGLARASSKYGMVNGFCMEGLRTFWDWFLYLIQMGFCGLLVVRGEMTVGEYVAMGQILAFVIAPMQIMVWMIIWFRISAVTLRRMLQTLDLDPEITDRPGAVALDQPAGSIEFEDVRFRYTPDGEEVLRGLSFRVESGSKVAIVGTSGAGKTSIFNLLMRYYDPAGGRVMVDGRDLREVELDSYHGNVSIVLQESFVYSASIRDNILFGNPEATDAQLEEAVDRAGLRPMIESMPRGMETVLKEGGDLSAGQLQRIGIARAVLRNPRFLYLDEATSSLDPVTEAEILAQLREISKGRTTLVIAHNIASVRDADEILVIDRGELVQRGRHEDLVRQGGLYQRMWEAELEKRDNRTAEERS